MKTKLALLVLTLALAACKAPAVPGPSATPAPSPTPEASPTPHNTDAAEGAGCEHLRNGPAVALTATRTAEGAPEVKVGKRYDLTLVAVPSDLAPMGGFVRFDVPRAEEWSFFLTKDVPLIARDASGLALTVIEKENRSVFCLEVKAHYIHLFDPGMITIEFGPTRETNMGLAIEETHPTANN
jgi:hypothetical protein